MRKMKRLLVLGGITLASMMAAAQNPIICDRYTPDPAPYVHNDTLYLFVDHDEDVTENNYFTGRYGELDLSGHSADGRDL